MVQKKVEALASLQILRIMYKFVCNLCFFVIKFHQLQRIKGSSLRHYEKDRGVIYIVNTRVL